MFSNFFPSKIAPFIR